MFHEYIRNESVYRANIRIRLLAYPLRGIVLSIQRIGKIRSAPFAAL